MDIIKTERKQYHKLKYNRYQKKQIIIETVTGWTFVSPLLLVALIFSTAAIGIAIWMTFQSGGSINGLKYVGVANWKKLIKPSLHLMLAIKNTLFFAFISVPIIMFTSLIISAILNSKFIKKKEIFLAIFFLPQVTSAIASTIIFKQLFSPDGIIKIDYYSDAKKIMWVVIISSIWGGVAGSLITMNTAFASIDKNQYEAAELDGASGLKKLLNITIPSIGPILSYSLIMGLIGGLGVFDGPYLLAATTGVPTDGMMTLILKGFFYIIPPANTSGNFVNIGLGTTILFFTSAIMAFFTIIANTLFPLSRRSN